MHQWDAKFIPYFSMQQANQFSKKKKKTPKTEKSHTFN